jgi:hypothetical protein
MDEWFLRKPMGLVLAHFPQPFGMRDGCGALARDFQGHGRKFCMISNERCDVRARPHDHAWPTLGMLTYLCNNFLNSNCYSRGHHFPERLAVCGNFMEIGCRALRVLNVHGSCRAE